MNSERRQSQPAVNPNAIRSGRANTLWIMLFGAAGLIALLVGMMMKLPESARQHANGNSEKTQTISMHCAAGIRPPVEAIAQMYQDEYGIKIDLQYGGSNTLLNQIKVNKFDTSDLYLAADDFYTDKAVEEGLAAETMPIAHMRPVIAVPKGNPKDIKSLDDLLVEGMRISVANPEQAAVGRATRKRLEKVEQGDSNRWAQLESLVTESGVFKPTVNDVANDVAIGAVDAGIVWDSTVAMPKFADDLVAVTVPELDGDPNLVSIAVLNSTRQPTAALKFARYLTARDKGLPVFEKAGMRPVEGDVWEEEPEINFFCGSVNRRAIEKIISDFSDREGVIVNTVYDGCGILTSRMGTIDEQKTSLGFPDVYMACDVYYLENVKTWFQEAENVSSAEIVIAVPKGSKKVTSLADLVKPGIRVAVGEPDQCTIGALTRRLLVREGLYDKLKEKQQQDGEVVVEKSSSALLVPDVVTGHVDASVAYITDTLATKDDIDIVRVNSPLNLAVQPFSIAKTSDHKYLVRRLFKRITSQPEAFETAGFQFRYGRNTDEATEGESP